MRSRHLRRLLVSLALSVPVVGAFAPAASAETGVAVTSFRSQQVVKFDTANPGVLTSTQPITGVRRNELIVGIDYRPANLDLYALGDTGRLYKLNPDTGAATQVQGPLSTVNPRRSQGFDFNPVPDRLRLVNDLEDNDRVNVDTGAVINDGDLKYAPGDPNFGRGPEVSGAGYTNSQAGATTTTLYDIDSGREVLARQAPPNDGTLNTVGSLGFGVTSEASLDVSPNSNTAFAALTRETQSVTRLYTMNLSTGQPTEVGPIGQGQRFRALAIQPATFQTASKPYAVGLGSFYDTDPLLSVGDTVPETSDPSKRYQMTGIPDGLGARDSSGGFTELFMNHEFNQGVQSESTIGEPRNRGAIVSRYRLGPDGSVVSGERAYDNTFINDSMVGPAPAVNNATRGFARFCSGSLAKATETGLDRDMYFANEETSSQDTFDPLGASSVAVFDNQAHALPDLGHFAWENTLVAPNTGNKTVVFGNEDGPPTPDSQLYVYSGDKNPGSTGAVARNGLSGGKLYTLRLPGKINEGDFTSGTATGKWDETENAGSLTSAQTEAAADADGAFGFIRIEDGAFDPNDPGTYYFVTTGSSTDGSNELGRLYRLKFNPNDPTASDPTIEVIYNADTIPGITGPSQDKANDIAISPDNIDISDDYLMINEDGTTESRTVMNNKQRDGSIWRFVPQNDAAAMANSRQRVAELNPPGRDGVPVGRGVWETTGIIDTEQQFGNDTWLFNVQAHPPTTPPGTQTVEDGQLLLMRPGGLIQQ